MRIKGFLLHELAYLLPFSALGLVAIAIVAILLSSSARGAARGLFDESPPPEATATSTSTPTVTSTPSATPTVTSTPSSFLVYLPAVVRRYANNSPLVRIYLPVALRSYSVVSPISPISPLAVKSLPDSSPQKEDGDWKSFLTDWLPWRR